MQILTGRVVNEGAVRILLDLFLVMVRRKVLPFLVVQWFEILVVVA